jgi:hypothetical protein
MSAWIGTRSEGTAVEVLGSGLGPGTDPQWGKTQGTTPSLNSDDRLAPIEEGVRVSAQCEPKADSKMVEVRGFVVDRPGTPLRKFTIRNTHVASLTAKEQEGAEGERRVKQSRASRSGPERRSNRD